MSRLLSPVGDGFTLLRTYSPSAASSVDIDNTILTSTFSHYLFIYSLMCSTDDAELYIRTSIDNGTNVDEGASDYIRTGTGTHHSTTALASHSSGGTAIIMNSTAGGAGVGNVAPEGAKGVIWLLHRGGASDYPTFAYENTLVDATARSSRMQGCGHRASTAEINFVRIMASAGNITGTLKVYGIK